jgi:coenzyme F420-dependent glucose-6-phosphate dehydrogenase
MIEMKVSFDTSRERALEDCRSGPRWPCPARSQDRRRGSARDGAPGRRADAEQAASRFIVSDDPDEHTERVCEYIDLGFSHLVFHAPGPDQGRFLDLYGEQILPRLRERYPD